MYIRKYYILLMLVLSCLRTTLAQEYNPVIMEKQDSIPAIEEWTRHLYVKTNAIGVGLLMVNAAVEVDLAEQWSFHLPVYYSGWNYIKSTIKFRTLSLQPEFRYWFEKKHRWFVGAHFGLGYYNLAFNGKYRYQDHEGETPALGGGLSIGYRMPLSENNRWHVEFVLGGGAYRQHYDRFYNEENVAEGQLYDTKKKTYWGLDNVAITFSYRFDLKKKKEDKR